MVKLNIDTGVEEFEINGGEAAGGGILRFNPSDPNVYNRFFEARDRLIEMDQEISERQKALRDETASDEDIECPQMPHEETIAVMKLMDRLRDDWGLKLVGE